MKIAICDDIQEYNEKLNKMLKDYMQRNKINSYEMKEYTSGLELIKVYNQGLHNYIFLDVDMPKLDGFKTADHIRKIDRHVSIIFITNMADQVYNCFKYGAKDYLCKPISQQNINTLMDRLLEEHNYKEEDHTYRITLKFGGIMYLYLPDVLYFESDGQYVIATTKKEIFTFHGNIGDVASDLESRNFIRIHRGRLINKIHVFQIFKNDLLLKSGEKLSVGKTYRGIVRSTFEREW